MFIFVERNTQTMAQNLYGSICLTDLIQHAKAKHSAFSKGRNGKIYVNFSQWINDEEDSYGNQSSILLNSKKEMKESEGKVYIGNAKLNKQEATPELTDQDVENIKEDDLPF